MEMRSIMCKKSEHGARPGADLGTDQFLLAFDPKKEYTPRG